LIANGSSRSVCDEPFLIFAAMGELSINRLLIWIPNSTRAEMQIIEAE
jgi:hypothetical protein